MKKKIELPIKVFVNRTQEKKELIQFLLNQHQGIGVLTIKGIIGVGKTRLVREALKEIKWREVLWGDCSYLADYVAYYPIRELIKAQIEKQGYDILQFLQPGHRAVLRKLVPDIFIGYQQEENGIEPMIDKLKFYEGVKEVIVRGKRAKVIVIDNVQWIDQGSVNIIRYLISILKNELINFVFIFRSDEETEVLNNLLTIIKSTNIKEISIEPFGEAEVKEIIQAVLEQAPQDEFVAYVLRSSGGNPFYIEEIIGNLVIEQNLIREGDKWQFIEPERSLISKSIAEIATTKYLSLGNAEQNVLELASVIGWFDIALIQELSGLSPIQIIGCIEEINKIGFVKYGEECIEFSDEISRNAIYKRVASKKNIKELHLKIGDRIKERSKDKEYEYIENLAYHYYQANDLDKGVRFCIQAGDKALDNYAEAAAIKYYQRAIELLKNSQKKRHREMHDFVSAKLRKLNQAGSKDKSDVLN